MGEVIQGNFKKHRDTNKGVLVDSCQVEGRKTRFTKRFAWLPVILDSGERIWFEPYVSYAKYDWSGGIMGGYTWLRIATARYPSEILLKDYRTGLTATAR